MRKYEIEENEDGVWVHAETPDGNTFSVFVNAGGWADGVIVDLWSEGDNIDCAAWEWSDIDPGSEEA